MSTVHQSICRVCTNCCGLEVTVDAGQIVKISGDPSNPAFEGYSCRKGRAHQGLYDHPDRLHHALKRQPDGSYRSLPLTSAIREIADRINTIIDRDGARAMGFFFGSPGYIDNTATPTFIDAFMTALGSNMKFDTASVDQPGKLLAKGLHGMWMAPPVDDVDPDVVLLLGTNPLISHQGAFSSPHEIHKTVHARGGALIVVDPRRTETAAKADLYLQCRPGYDAVILAGIIRVIIDEQLHDLEFVSAETTNLDQLRAAVDPFTPDRTADLAGVDAGDIVQAAHLFASARRGYATGGTGANMTAHGTLVEYLILCLDTLCGHRLRAGDLVRNDPCLIPQYAAPAKAQALPPFPAFGFGEPLRTRGLANSLGGYQASAMADEILLEGPGQIKGLISTGGNPAGALPDQIKTVQALQSLELFVQVDVQMSASARLAHYIIPAMLPYEMPGTTIVSDFVTIYSNGLGQSKPYAQYTDALVNPPPGSEAIEQWRFLYLLARELGLQLQLYPAFGSVVAGGQPTPIDMNTVPTNDELFDIIFTESRVPWREVRDTGPALFERGRRTVEPKDPGWTGRLDLGNALMMTELTSLDRNPQEDPDYPLRLICRRTPNAMNTPNLALPNGSAKQPTYNTTAVHPADLAELGLRPGDLVRITSPRADTIGIVDADDTLRRGVISMSHLFGGLPNQGDDVRQVGSSVNRLIANDDVWDAYSGQPRMTNIPVRLEAVLLDEPAPQP